MREWDNDSKTINKRKEALFLRRIFDIIAL
jgi:hypothetical protein